MQIARCGVSRQQSPAQGPALIGLVMLDLNRRKIPLSWRVLQSFPNNRFERSRGLASSVRQGGKSMIGINQLRLVSAQPRVAQPHR
jgi:hypothetical protein